MSELVDFNPKPSRGSMADDLAVTFVPMAAVEAGSGRMDVTQTRAFGDVKKGFTYFCDGDVLFAKITPCMENGKMAVARGLHNGVGFGSTEFHVLRPLEGLDAKYLYYFVSSSTFRGEASHHMTGAVGQKRVPLAFLQQSEIPFPTVEQQRRIVAEIEKQFSRLDEAVANLHRVKANLGRHRAAILKAALEGGLVESEAYLAKIEMRSFESGAALLGTALQRRRRNWLGRGYREPLAPDTSHLPALPEGWAWATIDQLSKLVTSGSRGWGEFYSQDGTLFIRAQDIKTDALNRDGIARVDVPEQIEGMRSNVEAGDVLVTITGANVTKAALVPSLGEVAYVSQHVALLKFVSAEFAPFLFAWIVSPANGRKVLEQWAYGAGKPGLSLEQVRALPVALPPLAEQHRIVAEVDRRLSIIREVEAEVDVNLKRAQALKQAVLQRAFSGQLLNQPTPNERTPALHLIPGTTTLAASARAALSAEIVHQLHALPTFGQIKHQKIFHLCEHVARLESLQVKYRRAGFGPLNLPVIEANEQIMEQQGWYAQRRRHGSAGHHYMRLRQAGGHAAYLDCFTSEQLATFRRVIDLMRDWSTDQCERLSTAYAAWNDLLLLGREPTPDAIVHEVLELWDDKKRRFTQQEWLAQIELLKKHGLVPTGFGQPTRSATDGVTLGLFDEARH